MTRIKKTSKKQFLHLWVTRLWTLKIPLPFKLHTLLLLVLYFQNFVIYVCECIYVVAATYLHDLCTAAENVRGRSWLRCASAECIHLPRIQISIGRRNLAFYEPAVWSVKQCSTRCARDNSLALNALGWRLKTYLFEP